MEAQLHRRVSSKVRPMHLSCTHGRSILTRFLFVLLLALVSLTVGCNDLTGAYDAAAPSTSTTEEPFQQAEGEILLESAGIAGPESFTGEAFVSMGPPSTLDMTTTTTEATATTTIVQGVQVQSVSGGTPALYGGSQSEKLVDKEGQLQFFAGNPDKAAAFCTALNVDPTLQWSGGVQVQPAQLRDYFAELTPLVLTRDTRVTNHGYRDGKPTPRQSVLQAGQIVLVDSYGVPRVRCECGNPLTPPTPVTTTPKYTGPKWPTFDPVNVVVVQQATVIIETFVLVDVSTGEVFGVPSGAEGPEDVLDTFRAWNIEVSLAWNDEPNLRVTNISWSGGFTLDPGLALDGAGDGTMHIDGTVWSKDNVGEATGTWVADASFSVAIGGGLGVDGSTPMLSIQPTVGDYSIEGVSVDAKVEENEPGLIDAINALLPTLTDQALARMDVPLVPLTSSVRSVTTDIAAGDFSGTATLTPYEP